MPIKIDRLIRSQRKTISLTVMPDATLEVRAPLHLSDAEIAYFVTQKERWIRSKQNVARNALTALPPEKTPGSGPAFWYLGQQYPLEIVAQAGLPLTLGGKFQLSAAALPRAKHVFENWYRQQAKAVLTSRVDLLSRQSGLYPTGIRITAARRRWGSCSPSGALNFTWRLVMAPLEVIDYVVIHELVHLKIKNHSKTFWNKVEELMPGYQGKRDWLIKNVGLLDIQFTIR